MTESDTNIDERAPDLQLDPRQRAMLEEMGLKVWWPASQAAPASAADAAAPEAAEGAPAPRGARPPVADAAGKPTSAPAPAPRVASPARPAPVAAAAPTASVGADIGADLLIDAPRHLFGAANATGGWLVVADMPPDLHGRHGEPLAGDEGRLLANMLRALRLDRGELPVHLMRAHRGERLLDDDAPQPAVQAFGPQLEALAPRLVLAMGPLAAQYLLQRREPIGKLRGAATPLPARPAAQVVVTYHPAYLLRNSADKARAWVDLCTAAAAFDATA